MNIQTPTKRRILEVVGVLLLITVLVPFVVFAVPQAVGAEHSYVVLSSSMSPEIHAGDAVVVNKIPAESVHRGDVITFMTGKHAAIRDGQGTNLVTHRVAKVVKRDGGVAFKTKGDANEEVDPWTIPASRLVGRVAFTIPLIGYVIEFAGTRLGFVALVAIPLGLLVLGELYDLARAARNTPKADRMTGTEPEDG